jgi:hypothetical protein
MKKIAMGLTSLLAFTPALAFAQTSAATILGTISAILNTLIPILIVAGVVFFLYGVLMYVVAATPDKKEDGKQKMLWGVIGLFVMVGFWGLIGVISNTFGIATGGANNVNVDVNPF